MFIKWLVVIYERLWKHTTGEPYTYIMRRKKWLLPSILIPVALLVAVLTGHLWWLWLLVSVGAFIAGHVYWGTKQKHL